MRFHPLAGLAVAMALLLAGCSEDPAPVADAPVEAAPAPQPQNRTVEIPFEIAAGAGTPVVGSNVPPPGSLRGGPFDVPDNATLLVVDAEWTCASGPTCEIAVVVYDEDGEVAEFQETFSPAHIEIAEPGAGEWGVSAFSSMNGSVVVDAQGTFVVAVTHLA